MQNESEVFLPSRSDNQKARRVYRPPVFSVHLFNLFEHSYIYGCLLFSAFSAAVVIGALTTYDEFRESNAPTLVYTEFTLFIYSILEFLLRLYASESKIRYHGLHGKGRFFYERYLFIDLTLLISYSIVFLLNLIKYYDSPNSFLNWLRLLQVFRFISLDRYIKSIPLICLISWRYRRALLAAIYSCVLLALPTSYFLWLVERSIETNGQYFFRTYTDAMWFTLNSMATIGYGDTWPQTFTGRLLTVTLCCLGLVLWTLPAGIISAGLTSIDEKYRQDERLRRPAARLIFAWWRLQLLKNRARTAYGQYNRDEKCKQFIARLLYVRLCREFRRSRFQADDGYDVQMRIDIDRILHNLQMIEEKLNLMNRHALE